MKIYNKFFITMLLVVVFSAAMSMVAPICLQIWSSMELSLTTNKVIFIGIIIAITSLLKILLIIYREKFASANRHRISGIN